MSFENVGAKLFAEEPTVHSWLKLTLKTSFMAPFGKSYEKVTLSHLIPKVHLEIGL